MKQITSKPRIFLDKQQTAGLSLKMSSHNMRRRFRRGSLMGTIAEDMERVRELYRSIKTPWKRLHFPEQPAEFLPPEKFLELAKEAVLVHHTKINHPFCVKLFRGEWTVKQLHGWIKQEYHAVMQ